MRGAGGDLLHLDALQALDAGRRDDGAVAVALPALAHAVGAPGKHLAAWDGAIEPQLNSSLTCLHINTCELYMYTCIIK